MKTLLHTSTFNKIDRSRLGPISRTHKVEIFKVVTPTGKVCLDFFKYWDNVIVEEFRTCDKKTIANLEKQYGFTLIEAA